MKNKYKVLILEDSPLATFVLNNLFETIYKDNFTIIGTTDTVKEGLKTINLHNPDLVILDVILSDDDGFKLFDALQIVNFETIITTVDSEHAIKAIKHDVLDFILKPVEANAFKMAIDKFLKKKLQHDSKNKKIRLVSATSIYIFNNNQIAFIEANGNNSILHHTKGTNSSISLPLISLEKELTNFGFFRIHKSYIVNIQLIAEYNKTEGGFVILYGYEGIKIPVSKQVKDLIVNLI